MRNPRHIAMALAIVLIWGVNFLAISHALDGFPPILLAALRFALTGSAALFLPRPKEVRWYWIAGISTFMFYGQYVLLFTSMAHGMPDGLASLVLQSQAPFTVLAAALLLRERTGGRQIAGIAAAVAGLAVIGAGRSGNVPLWALLLAIAAGASWALGSVCNRKAGAQNGFALMVWASLYAAPPLALTSLLTEGPHRIGHSFAHLHAGPVLGLLYVVVLSTFVGMGIWVVLLTKYPATAVAPYTLGVPPVGILAALIANGERMTAAEIAGCLVVLAGLVAIVWPRRADRPQREEGSARGFRRFGMVADPSVPAATVEGTTQAA